MIVCDSSLRALLGSGRIVLEPLEDRRIQTASIVGSRVFQDLD